ncbi:hypothetical protein AX14_013808 [Amanita brunnescens Koide BX004]|nr:hypothetical protein AX14_013808 [Amanita brunnescens Koide BX004]
MRGPDRIQADAIANYSHLFRKSEGLYLTFPNQNSMEEDFVQHTSGREIDLIVCSDSEAILGIGDQGVGGIGISLAKSALYTAFAGVDPGKTLSVVLDVGTNNEDLLKDELYVGWPHNRVRGEEYDKFVDKFVQLVRKHYPHSLLHFEDFGTSNAYSLLTRYRDTHAVFNDDIQGTGAVTLAALIGAVCVTKSRLSDQRYIIFGAGSAGTGIALQIRDAMVKMDNILEQEANQQFWLIDRYGLIKQSLGKDKIRDILQPFVRPDHEWDDVADEEGRVDLLEVVKKIKPTVLIGCSTRPGAFTEEVVKAMSDGCDRPIILPLSNPSRLVEVLPEQANKWSNGKALIATGSPFPPATMPDGRKYVIAECNNALLYPGLGFGAILAQPRRLTDSLIMAGAKRLASLSPAIRDPDLGLLPDLEDAPDANFEIGIAVAEKAVEEGIAAAPWVDDVKAGKTTVRKLAEQKRWSPRYSEYVYDPQGEN